MKIIVSVIFAIIIISFFMYFYKKEHVQNEKKHFFSIVAIFKNEEQYIEEWLNHHIKEGVDHFYLYSNDENIEKYKIFKKYEPYITLTMWTQETNDEYGTIQRKAYEDCVKKQKTQYLLMLDIDEFIISLTKNKRVCDILKKINTKDTKALKIQRFDFGSNGHITKPNGNVFDNYTKHEKICSTYKTIANSDFIDKFAKFYGVHDFPFLNKNGKIYNDYFTYKHTGYPNSCTSETVNEIPLAINHYYTKSKEEYLKRCEMWKDGGVNNVGFRQNCDKIFNERDKNESDHLSNN